MTFALLFLAALASVRVARGELIRLGDVRFRLTPVGVLALAIQVVIVTLFPGGSHDSHVAAHLVSYLLAGAFVVANLSVPWMWLIGTGGALNAIAIIANGGVMPASRDALASAGMEDPAVFTNSTVVDDARLEFLGDVFAVPHAWPATNVFSVGDVLIIVGVFLALHTLAASRLALRHMSFGREPATHQAP